MWLYVDPRAHTPMYKQVIDGIKEQIVRGLLKPGDRLPTVRELATILSLNHNTVAKAYQELEREEVIELVRGRGTFVSRQSDMRDMDYRKREIRKALKKWLVDAHHLHMSKGEMISLFEELLDELRSDKDGDDA